MRRAVRLAPFFLASLAIVVASHQPNYRPPDIGILWQDKLYHAIAYCIYGFTIAWMVQGAWQRRVVMMLLVGTLFALSDEWHQSFVPGRMSEWADVGADVVGVVTATVVSMVPAVRRLFEDRRPRRP